MIIQQSRGRPCDVRPGHDGAVHVSDLLRADIKRAAELKAAQRERKWWKLWN